MDKVRSNLVDDVLLEYYDCDLGPALTGPRHSHEDYQVCLSLNFPGEYRYRGTRFPVPVSSVTILHPGEVHSTRDPVARDTRSQYAVFYLPPGVVREAARLWRGKQGLLSEPFFAEPVISGDPAFRAFWRAWLAWNSEETVLARQSVLSEALNLALEAGGFDAPPRHSRAVHAKRCGNVASVLKSISRKTFPLTNCLNLSG